MLQSNITNFNVLFYYLGQHFSTLIKSSSGLSKGFDSYRVKICGPK